MNCRKNKHTSLMREYRTLIGEQSELSNNKKKKLKNLKAVLNH